MKIFKDGRHSITVGGEIYKADGNGIIEIPDAFKSQALEQGFVSSKGREAQLLREQQAPVATLPVA